MAGEAAETRITRSLGPLEVSGETGVRGHPWVVSKPVHATYWGPAKTRLFANADKPLASGLERPAMTLGSSVAR